ncbi:MAG: alpha-L-rhamnosidase [Candidatus Hydrogenedentes bacterium]|nr:alpha-L-rhamnosidase [Candidatus Hydrogenedentota bacterium]
MLEFLGEKDPRSRFLLNPCKIVWKSSCLENVSFEPLFGNPQKEILIKYDGDEPPAFVLDFGREIHGGVKLGQGMVRSKKPLPLKVTFGESVVESMGSPDQDHAVHDCTVLLPWYGSNEVGTTGFRYVRIEMLEPGTEWLCTEIKAVVLIQDLEYLGNFKCSDELLNRIWSVGAYTVHLCLQDYLWDGIKRDRLVWIGDLHVETVVVTHVFGRIPTVERSLDRVRDDTPLPGWMNGISSYSLWWLIIQEYLYFLYQDRKYLQEQKSYLLGLVKQLLSCVDSDGREKLPEARFLDWSTAGNKTAIHAGLHALLLWAFQCAEKLLVALNEDSLASDCRKFISRMKRYMPPEHEVKQAHALGVISGLENAVDINRLVFQKEPLKGLSTFYGYYILVARAMAHDYEGCISLIKDYWGKMLDFGATTFWEHFDIDWTVENPVPIDRVVPEGSRSIHRDFGEHCYVGLRHSLCHGWASGPTAWLIQYVLGITPIESGMRKIMIKPYLGVLEFAEGKLPTPYGEVWVRHEKDDKGRIQTVFKSPKEVEVVLKT